MLIEFMCHRFSLFIAIHITTSQTVFFLNQLTQYIVSYILRIVVTLVKNIFCHFQHIFPYYLGTDIPVQKRVSQEKTSYEGLDFKNLV